MTPVQTSRGVDEEVAEQLRAVVGRLARAAIRPDDLPQITAGVLGMLDRGGPQTAADLAALRQVRPQTMAATVKELTAAGLVTGGPHPVDGRKVVLDLTEAGRRALAQDRATRTRRIVSATAGLDQEEQELLARVVPLLERVVDRLNDRPGRLDH